MKGWSLLAVAVLAEVAGSLSLKGALDQPALYVLVAVGYVSAFVLLGAVLRTGMALGVAYGVWGAGGVASTAVGSSVVFREPLTPLMVAGIAVIMSGVLCIELGAHAARRAEDR
ncbi:MAG: QacE family quaternary ammonium compound efflux SMR transporter [Clavibacter sp.]|uniref:Integral membrane efflux protein n=1 Tax=Clavibacter sepedonicus TaxID=31964 RepID=B0RCP3_CLASE|nr:SMR family transporter [Clavibacter sepedonicus]MBD5382657.1 QacE family quaternary ammonium compound efflux SMR transporter [Clavibacter sp.]OQJ47477.1 QacE family quaternary ammonium compound efflux SMR transporter [Clavibacter sepedonicus]OQJ53032.1 QacE family quaternary ammonium compound efflux SMR transporter [Clavibacter sepedonicus]UUK67054.1 SMR family transporter [Clavibacter sepedonicus]CAQ01814.1 putative integral membrane efflux protein [Clavibacter sepedonicus]